MAEFKDRLLEAMKDKKITQAALATRLGVNRSLVHGWVHGRCVPKTDNLHLICLYLNVSEAWMMGVKGALKERVEVITPELSELIRIYKMLDMRGRTKLMACAYSLEENGGPKNGEL